ncbi:MAG: hypothetical protein A2015_14725 [Spirochaetes bacterium GWF1_31_7]|nr:MAG: hypothetical protein A2Y30_10410 [Spirochaetes bacterium GWE1_32_154]OHD47089.1 MAG: hypothetical protein A2Y29_02185 [Spirochaetes bacterium GWE2_31_10]OHD51732.1 MAG: hypothetical protein A2015_14725 [Spirochaetes bacterium GWF1_31_7]HBD92677.1 hypothetical protein [Spirochaetia bacterium]HBI38992.1 hypothetical protein [Spirochaetia bacterium]
MKIQTILLLILLSLKVYASEVKIIDLKPAPKQFFKTIKEWSIIDENNQKNFGYYKQLIDSSAIVGFTKTTYLKAIDKTKDQFQGKIDLNLMTDMFVSNTKYTNYIFLTAIPFSIGGALACTLGIGFTAGSILPLHNSNYIPYILLNYALSIPGIISMVALNFGIISSIVGTVYLGLGLYEYKKFISTKSKIIEELNKITISGSRDAIKFGYNISF